MKRKRRRCDSIHVPSDLFPLIKGILMLPPMAVYSFFHDQAHPPRERRVVAYIFRAIETGDGNALMNILDQVLGKVA